MSVTDRTAATDEEFRARFDRFGIFDEERVVEEAIKRSLDSADPNDWEPRALAAAAVAASRATQDGGECQQSDWCGPGSHCLCPPAALAPQAGDESRIVPLSCDPTPSEAGK